MRIPIDTKKKIAKSAYKNCGRDFDNSPVQFGPIYGFAKLHSMLIRQN